MTVYRTINIPPVVMSALLEAKDHFDRLRSGARLLGGQVRISQVRVIELLLGYAKAHPPAPDFICNFEFQSPPPGRPKGKKLGSKPQPPVSEDQARDDKAESQSPPTTDIFDISGFGDADPRRSDSTGSHHSW